MTRPVTRSSAATSPSRTMDDSQPASGRNWQQVRRPAPPAAALAPGDLAIAPALQVGAEPVSRRRRVAGEPLQIPDRGLLPLLVEPERPRRRLVGLDRVPMHERDVLQEPVPHVDFPGRNESAASSSMPAVPRYASSARGDTPGTRQRSAGDLPQLTRRPRRRLFARSRGKQKGRLPSYSWAIGPSASPETARTIVFWADESAAADLRPNAGACRAYHRARRRRSVAPQASRKTRLTRSYRGSRREAQALGGHRARASGRGRGRPDVAEDAPVLRAAAGDRGPGSGAARRPPADAG